MISEFNNSPIIDLEFINIGVIRARYPYPGSNTHRRIYGTEIETDRSMIYRAYMVFLERWPQKMELYNNRRKLTTVYVEKSEMEEWNPPR